MNGICYTCGRIIGEEHVEVEMKENFYEFCGSCFNLLGCEIAKVDHTPSFIQPERLNGETSEKEDAKV